MKRKLQVAVLTLASLWAVAVPTAEAALWDFIPITLTAQQTAQLTLASNTLIGLSTNATITSLGLGGLFTSLGAFIAPPTAPTT